MSRQFLMSRQYSSLLLAALALAGLALGFLSAQALANIVAPPSTANGVDAATTNRIDNDVQSLLQCYQVPSAVIAIVQDGKVVYSKAYGFRDLESKTPANIDTYYEIGSITKQFTAASILQLQEAGKLNIDAKLAAYLPNAPHASEVTLRQLLTHTSGLHEIFDEPGAADDQLATPTTFDHIMSLVAAEPLDFPPGSNWSYSNTGYILLGKIIETVSHQTYLQYLQTHIFDPLDMNHTFTTAEEHGLPNMAIGYRHVGGQMKQSPFFGPTWSSAAGFIVSTTADLEKWDSALTTGKVITPASYLEMTTPFMTTQHGSGNYGFGLFVDSAFDQPRIGHTGGAFGFTTADEYFPKQNARIIAFTNSGDRTPEPAEALTQVIFADLYPAVAASATRTAAEENSAITAAAKASFIQLQAGSDYSQFSSSVASKLSTGVGEKFAENFAGYGNPTAAIFRAKRVGDKGQWFDYLLEFGPGVFLKYSIRMDENGKVAGLTFP